MWPESYDWWKLVMAWNADRITIDKLKQFAIAVSDELGISVFNKMDLYYIFMQP